MSANAFLRAASTALFLGASLAACQGLSGVRFNGFSQDEKNPYAGSWSFEATPTSGPAVPGCVAEWGPFHVPITVDPSGAFNVADAAGSVSSFGAVSFQAPAPAENQCGGGSGSGNCPTAQRCAGTFSANDGSVSSWRMSRWP